MSTVFPRITIDTPTTTADAPGLVSAPVSMPRAIPQSAANPLAAEMIDPEAQRIERANRRKRWSGLMEEAALAPDAFFQKYPPPMIPGDDIEARKKRLVNRTFVRAAIGGGQLPADPTAFEVLRNRVADRLFEGRGKDSDEAFHGEVVRHATAGRDRREVFNSIRDEASRAAITGIVSGESASKAWATAREKVAAMPGFKAGDEADHHWEFSRNLTAKRAALAPFADDLWMVWKTFQAKGDTRSVAFSVYDKLTDRKDQQAFMGGLRALAKALPEAEQKDWWLNLKRTSGEAVGDMATNAVDFVATRQDVLNESARDTRSGGIPDLWPSDQAARQLVAERDKADAAAARKRIDFVADVQRIERQDYDPIDYYNEDGTWARVAENVLYSAPGAIATTAFAAVPGIGLPAYFASATESTYQDYRMRFEDSGMSYDEASRAAGLMAPVSGALEVALEKLQISAFGGKSPLGEKVVRAVNDRVSGSLGQLAIRSGVNALEEGMMEQFQGMLPDTIQWAAGQMGMNVPTMEWRNGKNGILDGFWKDSVQNIATMLPLSIILGGRGVIEDRRRIGAADRAADLQFKALGASEADISAYRSQTTFAGKLDALNGMMERRDPKGEPARLAAAEIEKQVAAAETATTEMQRAGLMPRVTVTKDGFAVIDDNTGETIGTTPNREGAMRIAAAHYDALKDEASARFSFVESMLRGAGALVNLDPKTAFSVESGNQMNIAKAIEEGIGTFERYKKQVELEEMAATGDNAVSRLIAGVSLAESGIRPAINRIFESGTVVTEAHEFAHQKRREAKKRGIWSLQEEIAFLRRPESFLGGKTSKTGERLAFLPAGVADADLTEEMLDEGFSKAVEAFVFRRRHKENRGSKENLIPNDALNQNVLALGNIVQANTAGKFRAFFDGIKAFFGRAMETAVLMRKAAREGKFDEGAHEAYLSKMLGLSEVDELAGMVRDEHAAIIGAAEAFQASEDMPFSLGNRQAAMNLSHVPTNEPGVANIGDGSLPVNSAIIHRTLYTGQPAGLNVIPKTTRSEIPLAYAFLTDSPEVAAQYAGTARSELESDDNYSTDRNGEVYEIRASFKKTLDLDDSIDEYLWTPYLAPEPDVLDRFDSWLDESDGRFERVAEKFGFKIDEDDVGGSRKDLARIVIASGNAPKTIKRVIAEKLRLNEENGGFVDPRTGHQYPFDFDLDSVISDKWINSRGQGRFSQDALDNSPTGQAMVLFPKIGEQILKDGGYDSMRHSDSEVGGTTWIALSPDTIPIRRRFDQSAPQSSGAFSLAPASVADALKQRDAEYMAAVKRGDLETAQRMVDEAAKSAGFTVEAIHGGISGITSFDAEKIKTQDGGSGFYFSTDMSSGHAENYAEKVGGKVYRAFLKLRRPYYSPTAYTNTPSNDENVWKTTLVSIQNLYGLTAREMGLFVDHFQGLTLNVLANPHEFAYRISTLMDRDVFQKFSLKAQAGITTMRNTLLGEFGMQNKLDLIGFLTNHDGIIYKKGSVTTVLNPNQIKSADPVTYDADGNVIPLSQRFNPADDRISYSLAPASMADALAIRAAQVTDPRAKSAMFRAMADKLGALVRLRDEFAVVAGKIVLLRAVPDPRTTASLKKEAAFREADLRARYEDEVSAKWQGLLEDGDLVKLKEQPVHAHLADPASPLRGRVMSAKQAIARGLDFFDPKKHGDYDGADGVSRSVFGGSLMPDQAAQELFDAGLIKHPTPDAMWDALKREAASVGRMKEHAAKAKAELADARARAKQEAAAWRKTAAKEQAAAYSPRKRLLRAMAMLDAILSSVPAEVRGRVGGYTPLARLGSDEAMLDFLQDRLGKTEAAVEKYLVREYGKMFVKVLEREKVKKNAAGKRPKGKAGADVHAIFANVRRATAWSGAEAEAHVAKLEAELNDANNPPTAEREAALLQEIGIIPLVADWKNADAARRAAAFESANRILTEGMAEFASKKLRERERRAAVRETLQGQTGKTGQASEIDDTQIADGSPKTFWKKYIWAAGSFEQFMHRIFGEDSAEAQRLVDMQREADFQKEDEVQAEADGIEEFFTGLAGGNALKGSEIHWRLKQKDKKVMDRKLSEMAMVTVTLQWRQEDGQRHMIGHKDDDGNPSGDWHYGQDFVDACEAALSPEAKAWRSYLTEKYGAEWATLNPIYRAEYGTDLPRHANYSPLSSKPLITKDNGIADPVTGQAVNSMGGTPASLRTRAQGAIAEPRFPDSDELYIAHVKQLAHWKAYVSFQQEYSSLIAHRKTMNTIEAAGGADAAHVALKWGEYFTAGGFRDASASLALFSTISKVTNNAAGVALVGRAGVLAVQSTQLGAALAEIPTVDYTTRFAKLMTGKLGWGAAIKSTYIQRRLKQMPPAVRMAMDGLAAAKPNRIKHEVRKLGQLISGADALFTAGTYAIIYDYHLTQARKDGASETEAVEIATKAAERSTDRVAQPTRPGAKSLWEVTTANNPVWRLSWAFGSETRQKLALAAFTLANPRVSAGRKARALAVAWLIGGMGATLIRTIWRDMREHDDEEWFDSRNWGWKRFLLQSLFGPLTGLPIVGDLIEASAFAATGEFISESNVLSTIPNAFKALRHVLTSDQQDTETAFRDADAILSGVGAFFPTAGAAASLSHLARDIYGAAKNALD